MKTEMNLRFTLAERDKEIARLNHIIGAMNDFIVEHLNDNSLDHMYRQGFKDCYDKLTCLVEQHEEEK